jgi:prophage tail gpP-like protein
MSDFVTREGQSYADVSREAYGSEEYVSILIAANRGKGEPFNEGTVLFAPTIPSAPKNKTTVAPSDDPNEVVIQIDGKTFRNWVSVEITNNVAQMSSISIIAPFNPSDAEARESFRPFTFPPIVVYIGGKRIFTGTMIDVNPILTPDAHEVQVNGYAAPGVLGDCQATGDYEFSDLNLVSIAEKLAAPYGIGVDTGYGFTSDVFVDRPIISPTEPVLAFLAKLARQQNLLITNNAAGDLLIHRPGLGIQHPVGYLEEGKKPLLYVGASFDAQRYYSSVTGMEETILQATVEGGLPGERYEASNPHRTKQLRALTIGIPDAHGGQFPEAVVARMGRMFANIASYEIHVPSWRDAEGRLWETDRFIYVKAPGAMIYEKYLFIIKSVQFQKTSSTELAIMQLALPEVYEGRVPEKLPWQES